MPAVEQYLNQHIANEKERAARSRRAAKALTYGQFNLNELIEELKEIVTKADLWKATKVQGYYLKPVDMTSYKRSSVKGLKSKTYDSDARRAVPAVPFGMIGTTGKVAEQRVAILEMLICGDTTENKPSQEMEKVYKKVATSLTEEDIAIFDAGFSLIDALTHRILQCVVRLAKNCTFGEKPGEIPPRTSNKGPEPSRHQAEIVRPLARQHGEKTLPKTEADKTILFRSDADQEVKIEIWTSVYLLERHLDRLGDDLQSQQLKETLRKIPLKIAAIHHPNYKEPLLLGTPLTLLQPQSMYAIYPERWPIEGIPQTGKYLLSGGGGRHYVHQKQAIIRLPALTMIFGSLFKYLAAISPPIRSGFWDRDVKPTYGRLLKHLKKVGLPLSYQLSKKLSVTAHLPIGYEAIRLAMA